MFVRKRINISCLYLIQVTDEAFPDEGGRKMMSFQPTNVGEGDHSGVQLPKLSRLISSFFLLLFFYFEQERHLVEDVWHISRVHNHK